MRAAAATRSALRAGSSAAGKAGAASGSKRRRVALNQSSSAREPRAASHSRGRGARLKSFVGLV